MPKYKTIKLKSPIFAGHKNDMKLRKVGYDVIAIKSEINPLTGIADMIVGQWRVKRVFYNN